MRCVVLSARSVSQWVHVILWMLLLSSVSVGADEELRAIEPVESDRRGTRLLDIGTDEFRVRGHISDMAFSPDGQLIAAALMNTNTPRIHLLDVATGKQVRLIMVEEEPQGWVNCIAFSADGTRLLWGEVDGSIGMWDLAGDRLLFREKLPSGMVNIVAFANQHDWFACGTSDKGVHLREFANPAEDIGSVQVGEKPHLPADIGRNAIHSLAFSADDRLLFTGESNAGGVSVFHTDDGKLVRRLIDPDAGGRGLANHRIRSLAMSHDGNFLMAAGRRTVKREATSLKYGPTNVSLSEVRLWDPETGEKIRDLHGPEDYGKGYAAISSDGKQIAIGDYSRLRIIDAVSGEASQTIKLPGWWSGEPAFSPDGKLVAITIGNAVALFDVQTGERLHHNPQSPVGLPRAAAWSPTGDRIVTAHQDGQIRVWDSQTGKLVWHRELAPVISRNGWMAGPCFVSFTSNGRSVVAVGRRDDPVEDLNGVVLVCNASGGTVSSTLHLREVRHAKISPDNERVVVATSQGRGGHTRFTAIQLATGDVLFSIPPVYERVAFDSCEAMQFRPASRTLDVALSGGEVISLDSLTGEEQHRFIADWRTKGQMFTPSGRPREPSLREGAFSADGQTLVSSSEDHVYIWDVEAGTLRLKIHHPHAKRCKVCLSPDGKTIATSDGQYAANYHEDTIRLYDVETGNEVMQIDPAGNRAGVLAFSPDGTKLLTGYYRGSATIWDVSR